MTILLHEGDLPPGLDFGPIIALDTETMGLNLARDRLCVVQLTDGGGTVHVVRMAPGPLRAPNLAGLLSDTRHLKLFHYARFDVAVLRRQLGVACQPIYCTKIASKLVRTYTDRHGLKDLCRELLGLDLDKSEQSSDWGAAELSPSQLDYAARDVVHLHRLRERLDAMLAREGRAELAQRCFDFLPVRAELDLAGWPEHDIFAH